MSGPGQQIRLLAFFSYSRREKVALTGEHLHV